MAILGCKGDHPPRIGQKGLVKLGFQVKFTESSAGSWEALLVLGLGMIWLPGRVC